MRVLQINENDAAGGAALVALNLHRAYRDCGVDAWLSVGRKLGNDPGVIGPRRPYGPLAWRRSIDDWGSRLMKGTGWSEAGPVSQSSRMFLSRLVRAIAEPRHAATVLMGLDDFRFPDTMNLLRDIEPSPDILHAHNLHGNYFDLRALPGLARTVPVVLTLHDAWTFSGHCAHSVDCERWRIGCGQCPDLSLHPRVYRDATRTNWAKKRQIFSECAIHLATPCRWLMDQAEASLLSGSIRSSRVIPNGIDLAVFRSGIQLEVRRKLGITPEASPVVLFAANSLVDGGWKDAASFRRVLAGLARSSGSRRAILIGIGYAVTGPHDATLGEVRFVPYQPNPRLMAEYFQAADVYVHPARSDTFPTMILESLACGTPVVATSVGGIPEQIVTHGESTGILVPPNESEAMTRAITFLLEHPEVCRRMGDTAAVYARARFDLRQQAKAYLQWYEEVLLLSKAESGRGRPGGFGT